MIFDTHSISTMPSARSASQGLGSLLKSWWDYYWRQRAKRTAVLMLHSLDDHCRSEIESVVYGKHGHRRLRYEQDWR